ncbi:MAG: Diadenylate cyclase [Chthoniobacter sp.]|nr:Diadenylate cyclase [Chthoniobacter sp.]
MEEIWRFAAHRWTDAVEIALLTFAIYFTWRLFKGTPGSNVLAGLVTLFLGVTLLSQLLGLPVIGWIATRLSAVLIIAILIIFQPELRRALAALGSHRLFLTARQSPAAVDQLTELTFELANRQLGALLAIERGQNIETFAQSGVPIDCALSTELAVSIFFPKTPLHDGGIIIRNDRIVSAACIFPVSQVADLDRSLGLRHRAALGLTEESDAIVIVVSEETGIVSICHHGRIERSFDPETLKTRLAQLFLLKNERSNPEQLGSKDRVAGSRSRALGGDPKEHRDNPLAF